MKKYLITLLFSCFYFYMSYATAISISISGFSYTPSSITVNVGDVVTIEASSFHPLIQVSQATWDANSSTQLQGGFNSTSNFELTITAGMAGSTIFYVCGNHVASGMKGQITVNVAAGISENQSREFNMTVFPNPVSSNGWLNISTKKSGKINLTLYDLQGRIVNTLMNNYLQAGEITMPFNAAHLQKGIYILQLRTTTGLLRKQITIQ
jgi:plastocyanin